MGAYHSECEVYQKYNKKKEEDRAERYKNRELTTQLIDHRSKTIKKCFTEGENSMDKDYMNILRKSMDDCIKGAYEEGLNDAWECARKITARIEQGGLANPELLTMFDFRICSDILVRYTPQEAIAKIRQYEEKQTDNCPKKKPNELSSDCDRFEPKPCQH